MVKHTTTLTLEIDISQRFKAKVHNVSGEVESFMRRRLAELDGKEPLQVSQDDYERLRNQQLELSREADKIVKGLREQKVWESLSATADELGLNMKDLNNLDKTIPQLFEAWQDAPDYMHRFVTYLEKLREKWTVQNQLLRIRTAGQQSSMSSEEEEKK
jgi:hypothetical protein